MKAVVARVSSSWKHTKVSNASAATPNSNSAAERQSPVVWLRFIGNRRSPEDSAPVPAHAAPAGRLRFSMTLKVARPIASRSRRRSRRRSCDGSTLGSRRSTWCGSLPCHEETGGPRSRDRCGGAARRLSLYLDAGYRAAVTEARVKLHLRDVVSAPATADRGPGTAAPREARRNGATTPFCIDASRIPSRPSGGPRSLSRYQGIAAFLFAMGAGRGYEQDTPVEPPRPMHIARRYRADDGACPPAASYAAVSPRRRRRTSRRSPHRAQPRAIIA